MRNTSEPNRQKLTEIAVRKAQPRPDGTYLIWDKHTRGLALRVHPSGRKVWNTIYRANGKPRWLRIGDASTIGLSRCRMFAAETALAVAKVPTQRPSDAPSAAQDLRRTGHEIR